jgi:hypothetical protein
MFLFGPGLFGLGIALRMRLKTTSSEEGYVEITRPLVLYSLVRGGELCGRVH